MSVIHLISVSILSACLLVCTAAEAAEKKFSFQFTLEQPALTSAGIFDHQGHLVRVLWTTNQFEAGPHPGSWDGRNDFGSNAPASEYEWRVVVNHCLYTNVGAIGQNYDTPNDKGHVPSHMASVAADREGAIYTANGWTRRERTSRNGIRMADRSMTPRTRWIFNPLRVLLDGTEAMDYLAGNGQFADRTIPSIIFTDLHMPARGGIALVKSVKRHTEFFEIPIIVMIDSDIQKTSERLY